jgi:hypothetical protein
LRQFLDSLHKTEAGKFHQETDGCAVFATAETVIKLLGRAYGETGRFFAVKRAQARHVGASLLQLDIVADHVNDVDAIEKILDESRRYHVCE